MSQQEYTSDSPQTVMDDNLNGEAEANSDEDNDRPSTGRWRTISFFTITVSPIIHPNQQKIISLEEN